MVWQFQAQDLQLEQQQSHHESVLLFLLIVSRFLQQQPLHPPFVANQSRATDSTSFDLISVLLRDMHQRNGHNNEQ